MNARHLALNVLVRIEKDHAYSHLALGNALDESELSPEDKRLATNLVYGTLSWRRALDKIITGASKRDFKEIDPYILHVLRLGVYQIVFMRVPDRAAVDESVELAKKENEPAAGFVNGLLRTVARTEKHVWWREQDKTDKPVRYLGERYSLPGWIANRLVQTLGLEGAEAAAAAFNDPPELWARDTSGVTVKIERFEDVREDVANRSLFIQDLGAQYAVLACGDVTGKNVLDACAGLGGKTLFLADRGANVVAVEPNVARLAIVDDPRIKSVEGDIQSFQSDTLFDVVLVDAPCTGLGVIRRHPETRWRKSEADIQSLAPIQTDILDAASKWVAPGGTLVYCVCTFTREETGKQREKFLERNDQFVSRPLVISDVLQTDDGFVQLWPHKHSSDAFFICTMERKDHA